MLRSGRKADAQFKAELQVLGESVKHHVEEEESKVFAIARDIMGKEELEEIGEAWERAKKRGAVKSRQTQPGATAAKKRSKVAQAVAFAIGAAHNHHGAKISRRYDPAR